MRFRSAVDAIGAWWAGRTEVWPGPRKPTMSNTDSKTPSSSAAAIDTSAARASGKPSFEDRIGHPPGLFVLFFAEMWERFSYYGMRALLVFYMMKGFLGFNDHDAYSTYGAYTALVYMTPFVGGLIADRLLGPRAAVVIGGILMAAGHLLMTLEHEIPFFLALGLLIVGNGLFKPNISTMVGSLYPDAARRDAGFTIFYMGVNLGAAMAPLLCGYVGEKFGWHYGFGLATGGMLIGLAVFTMPNRIIQALIALGALAGISTFIWKVIGQSWIIWAVNLPVAVALLIAAFIAVWALSDAGLPAGTGEPADKQKAKRWLPIIVIASFITVPVAALLVRHHLAGSVLGIFGLFAYGFMGVEAFRSTKIVRERLFVVLILFFFSTLFWAFFEQAGSSMNNFADRNVDRVAESRVLTAADVGQEIDIVVNQEQLGFEIDGSVFTMTELDAARKKAREDGGTETRHIVVTEKMVGMGIEGSEVPASEFQAANPMFILIFGLIFAAIWTMLGKRNLEPSTPIKFGLGLIQLAAGFAVLWWAAGSLADGRGMVGAGWLILAYLLHTTGELCLSPIGLSMVTKLSPKHLVSTAMGGWFLATAFSEYLAGKIATLTGVSHGGGGESAGVPAPIETLHVYGDVFGKIGLAAAASGVLLFALSPLLKKWMHTDVEDEA